ncbi:hypothetical protein BWZ20_12730 [Winogradskyella sp. J14-2]|uniref:M56 family metallopeptidase n=1 Tax=Winogradskyella sp. J14-2 TaxID=1936080 RepID=UPI000972B8BD|nr:M56 family metallopeptidase [Winogradskyella sp. J14-2]APY09115.1 hypothetical protein BWZ20_12730 [Winogradskyella sp. J14-2]
MEYLLKASAVVCIFYICYQLLLKRETFFNHNRWFLLLGLVIALIFPLIVIPISIPVETIASPQIAFQVSEATTDKAPVTIEETFNWMSLLPILYIIGFSVLFLQFLFQFGSLIRLLLKNPKDKDGIYTYVIVNHKISPFSFFKWIVYNPKDFSNEELELILMHEKVHVNQMHSLDVLFSQLACVIFWFNPLIWFYKKEVHQNLEYIADRETQATTKNEKAYQHLLLKTSIYNTNNSLSNNFYNSQIKNRIIMLHKSKSHQKKQLRYLLILPLLAGLLMSMNTEKVYVNEITTTKNTNETIEFLVTKNSTDTELKAMSKAIEDKGGTLVFSQIKRNSNNELIDIFVKFYNRSYGGGNAETPIEDFIIYKEFFDDYAGYVGSPQNATFHFDRDKKQNESDYRALQKRAISKMKVLGMQHKDLSTKKEEKPKSKKSEKQKVKQESIASEKEFIITTINKNTTDAELESIKEKLNQEGVTIKIKGIKRNKKGEIRAIKIEAKSKNSSTKYQISSDDEAIEPIHIAFDKEHSTITISNKDHKTKKHSYIIKTEDGDKHKIQKTGNSNNVFVISKEKVNQVKGDTMYVVVDKDKRAKTIEVIAEDDDEVEVILEEKIGNNVWISDENITKEDDIIIIQNAYDDENMFISTSNGKDPLFMVNDKEVSKDKFIKMKPKNIESVTVLKDKSAIEKYGDKAKNGVIIIKTKKD